MVNVPITPQPRFRLSPCVPHLRLVVPNGTASLLHQLGVVAALASVGAVAMVPHLLWYRGHEGDGKAHPDVRMAGRRSRQLSYCNSHTGLVSHTAVFE